MTDTTRSQTEIERTFGWWDMFVPPEEDPRSDGGQVGERDTLVGSLADHRLTLRLKCTGLDAEAMARRSVPPSDLSLLGLVRHLARVEHFWFRRVMAGQDSPPPYRTAERPYLDFEGAVPDPEVVAEAWRTWRDEVAFAERFVAEAPGLDITGEHEDCPIELRQVLVHMIGEYARHNGHADFLRERIDGRVGQ
ncbi:DinB family protein [Streptomyces sp. 7R007]